ncbi:MAG: phosphocholine cytidylyltransferase family protein [Rhodospirillales bacterium]
MKAIILSAGQGSRLLPLTQDRPKCLLPIGAYTLLEWQVRAIAAAGITEIAVVIGFKAELMEAELARLAQLGPKITPIFNPFYKVADNTGSCWLAREAMAGDFLLVNGDTLFERALLKQVLGSPVASITVTVDRKPAYDEDDMKVQEKSGRLLAIGKKLPLDTVNAESIGMLLFRGDGPKLFRDAVEATMRTPDGAKIWYLQVIHTLAQRQAIATADICGLAWGEVDFPPDLDQVREMVATWADR